jgi:hypothetical protein
MAALRLRAGAKAPNQLRLERHRSACQHRTPDAILAEVAVLTREGQLIFFAQFLHAGGRWARLLEQCPLHYEGNRGSGAANVVGTAALSILCGHWRYAHINAVRGDRLNPDISSISR